MHRIVCIHDTVSSPRTTRKTMTRIATKGVVQALAGGRTKTVPGPLYNELFWPSHLYQSGDRFTKITAGKSNNAGLVSTRRFKTASAGQPMPPTSKRPVRGKRSHNAEIYGLAIVRPGDGILEAGDLDRLAARCWQLLDELGLPADPNRIVGHSELTSRKVDPAPWATFMPQLRTRMNILHYTPAAALDVSWYSDELAAATELGITDGTRPAAAATRAETAVMCLRAYDRMLEQVKQ